jgi:hypothetical protein
MRTKTTPFPAIANLDASTDLFYALSGGEEPDVVVGSPASPPNEELELGVDPAAADVDYTTIDTSGTISSTAKFAAYTAALVFMDKSVQAVGRDSPRIPTHRELLQVGLPTTIQVQARRYLSSLGAITVNVRTRIDSRFQTIGELQSYLRSLPPEQRYASKGSK